ncbi:phosphopantetheine-binding protein [Actinacidiphila sp. bgisy145]|uniref:phosphopantetheine-binding protein n=1 Tax=Actinacidiphila sp. bgisy145 TaxID=3413792 RepID=UPI003EBF2C76
MTPPDPSSPPTAPDPAAPAPSAPGPGPHPSPDPDSDPRLDLERLRATVADVLGVAPEQVGDDDNLLELGVESVRVMAISARLRRYRLRIGYARMIEEPTLRAWWRLIAEAAGDRAAG